MSKKSGRRPFIFLMAFIFVLSLGFSLFIKTGYNLTGRESLSNLFAVTVKTILHRRGLSDEGKALKYIKLLNARGIRRVNIIPGMAITFTAAEVAGLRKEHVWSFLAGKVLEPFYNKPILQFLNRLGKKGVDRSYIPNRFRNASFKDIRDQLGSISTIMMVLSFILLGLLVLFLTKWSKAIVPGVLILIASLPAIIAYGLLKSLLNRSLVIPGINRAAIDRMTSSAGEFLLDLIRQTYLLPFIVGVVLLAGGFVMYMISPGRVKKKDNA